MMEIKGQKSSKTATYEVNHIESKDLISCELFFNNDLKKTHPLPKGAGKGGEGIKHSL